MLFHHVSFTFWFAIFGGGGREIYSFCLAREMWSLLTKKGCVVFCNIHKTWHKHFCLLKLLCKIPFLLKLKCICLGIYNYEENGD